jgi:hypothetical protein
MLSKRYKSIQASFDLDKEGEHSYKKYRKHTYRGQPTKWKKRFDEKEQKVEVNYLFHLRKSVSRLLR